MKRYNRWNNIVGWAVFAVAALTYLVTMEPSASLWDCSEFIATSYKLEVGHPPGAPLFMMMARLATMLAPSTEYVPLMVNAMNSLASAFCILFMFWTVTHLGRRIYSAQGRELTDANMWTVLGAGAVGALAYTFTDTFWFSAYEGEVYALSSMFTALVVWLMLKWEDQADEPHATRWLILIAYLMGLSIGIHILNLLTVPALVYIYYFRKYATVTFKGFCIASVIALAILWFINGLIIPYTVYIGAMVDVLFVNTFGLPVNSGIAVFALSLFALLGWSVWYTHRRGRVVWNTLLLATTMILLGYRSYATVTIRAAANPPMNSNDPSNPHALFSVLNRDQYGGRPLLYGAYYSAPVESVVESTRYYIDDEGRYATASFPTGYTHPQQFMHLFPRMWNYAKSPDEYKQWAAYRTKVETLRDEQGNVLRDEKGQPLRGEVLDYGTKRTYDDGYSEPRVITEPTFLENLNYFFSYQLNYMYWRYFLWNFVGRQSDIQPAGSTTITDGNWLSGIDAIDRIYLGPQENLPREVADNKARNTYYFLPFILGLIGLIYQLNRDPKNFLIVLSLFVMMGIALVVYFNTSPGEPRERDYVYAGSFYAFAMWIGFGVMAFKDLIVRLTKRDDRTAAVAATVIGLVVPGILCAENWDDHDRSGRTYAHDIGWNYLQSTLPNSIILNYGDNDTFPLWLNQEVDGLRPDVRIMNTSYLGGEWYIDEMKTRANEAAGVPFTLPRSKYWYRNDYVPVYERVNRPVEAREAIEFFASDDQRTKVQLSDGSSSDYLPSKTLMLPVDKQNVLRSGIVAEKDKDLIVDTVYIKLSGDYLNKGELMIVDMLSNYDWTRPIYLTQPYIFQKFGLVDYLQFDGYAYRFVPILTPYRQAGEVGRIDPEYAVPLLLDVFRYGNLDDEKVYSDYFTQYNLSAARAREAFARVAKELIRRGDEKPNFPDSLGITEATNRELAIRLLDEGMRRMPPAQVRYTSNNTLPFIEAYYAAGAADKGDALMLDYARNLMEYVDYYFQFDGWQYDSITDALDEKLDLLGNLYSMAGYLKRDAVLTELNAYYRSLGVTEEELIQPDSAYLDYEVSDTAAVN